MERSKKKKNLGMKLRTVAKELSKKKNAEFRLFAGFQFVIDFLSQKQ